MSEKRDLKTATSIIRGIVESAPACSCIGAYKTRGLIDPDCARCNGPDLTRAERWIEQWSPPSDKKAVAPSVIRQRLGSWKKIAKAIRLGLDGAPFSWTAGELESYREKAAAMGATLVTRSWLERNGYRLKRRVRPVGSGYFRAPISKQADLYVLECQAVKK